MFFIIFIVIATLSIFLAFKNKEFFQSNVYNMISNKINISDDKLSIDSKQKEEVESDHSKNIYYNDYEPQAYDSNESSLKSLTETDSSIKTYSELFNKKNNREEYEEEQEEEQEEEHEKEAEDNYTIVENEEENYTKGQIEEEKYIKDELAEEEDVLKKFRKNISEVAAYDEEESKFKNFDK